MAHDGIFRCSSWWRTLCCAACLVALAAAAPLSAQVDNLKFDHLSLEEGLSQSSIQWILQDSKGFMWFSTQDGLNMYDGYSFRAYRHDPMDRSTLAGNYVGRIYEDGAGDLWIVLGVGGLNRLDRASGRFTYYTSDPRNTTTLSSNNVTAILDDRRGNVWIGTDNGLNRFDRATGAFTRYTYIGSSEESRNSNVINAILQDRSGLIWIGTNNGLRKYNPATGDFTVYSGGAVAPNRLSGKTITALYEDRSGLLWIGTRDGGTNSYNPRSNRFTHYASHPFDPASLSSNTITCIGEDRTGAVWIGTDNGLNRLERTTDSFVRYLHHPDDPRTISGDNIASIVEDSYGVLWITTAAGDLNMYDQRANRFTHLRHRPTDPASLSSNRVSMLFEDRSGNFWIGTLGGGVNKLSRVKQKFRTYAFLPGDRTQTTMPSVTAIHQDRTGALWVGTQEDGLKKFDPRGERVVTYRNDPFNQASLTPGAITAIIADRTGTLWIGTTAGLTAFNPATGRFTRYTSSETNPSALSSNLVNTICEDSLGTLWVGTNNGLNALDRATGRFTHYLHDPANPRSLPSALVWTIYEDRSGTLWIGTAVGGLAKLDRATGTFMRYSYDPANVLSINNRTIDVIHEDAAGTLWIGTYSGGLNRFDRSRGTFAHLTEKNGLANNRVNGILEDRHGNLWLSTNRGISRYSPAENTFRNYDYTDGLQSNEFNRGAFCEMRDGEMFFGGINGLNSFFPDSIRDNRYIPPVVLTSFKKFDREIQFEVPVFDVRSIELSYEENFFSIEFAALDYTAPAKNAYAYMMEGFDNGWIHSGTRRYASYTNLDPGTYTFRYKGANNDGIWNEVTIPVKITIHPPFWQTAWFRLLVLLLAGGVTLVIHKVRVRSIKAQKKRLEELVEVRTSELQERTDELQAARDELEVRVQARTGELRQTNESLMSEIAERRQAQAELKRLKEFHENLVHTMAEGVIVQDTSGTVTFANPAAASSLGYTVDELVGKHWTAFIPSNLHPIVQAADARRAEGKSDHYEIQQIRKDGKRISVLVGGSSLFWEGRFIGTIAVFTNISERKIAEEKIKDQAALIDNAHDAIAVCDIDGCITYWNRSAETVYGWQRREAVGRNAKELLHREQSPELVEAQRVVLEKGEWSGELHQVTREGKGVIADSRWTLLRDVEGYPKSILMINSDITEKVKLKLQFLRSQRMESIGTLAGGIAHDLNNVLAPILMSIQILQPRIADERMAKLLSTIETSAKRGADIVKQVLLFARGTEVRHEELHPKQFIKEIQTIVRETFPKLIQIRTEIPDGLWTISGDATQLHQVLLNLCVNARDAMPDGGILTIAAGNATIDEAHLRLHAGAKPGRYVALTVSDTGMGMPPDVMVKIFEPFFTTKGVGKGTGLGLATVNGIVKSHGGFVNVYSELGKGSSFKMYFPAGGVVEQREREHPESIPAGNGQTILIVDDEFAIRQVAKGTLETYGYRVMTANDGLEAEEVYRGHSAAINAVITDMMMPERDGPATIKALRQINPNVRIIATSGLLSHDAVQKEIRREVNAFLTKPYTAETLLRTLHTVLTAAGNGDATPAVPIEPKPGMN